MDEIAKLKTQVSFALAREYILFIICASKDNGFRNYYLTERQRTTLLEACS